MNTDKLTTLLNAATAIFGGGSVIAHTFGADPFSIAFGVLAGCAHFAAGYFTNKPVN
jgi:hypothetical protein